MGAVSDVRSAGFRARRRVSRHVASLGIAAVLASAGTSWAGPVRDGSIDSGVDGADQASTDMPAFRAPPSVHEADAPTAITPLTPAAAA